MLLKKIKHNVTVMTLISAEFSEFNLLNKIWQNLNYAAVNY